MKMPQDLGPVHFIGIGGIGMSGIAEVLHMLGYTVQGSDLSESANVKRLRDKGIAVKVGHDDIAVAVQPEADGTAGAVAAAHELLRPDAPVVVLAG